MPVGTAGRVHGYTRREGREQQEEEDGEEVLAVVLAAALCSF